MKKELLAFVTTHVANLKDVCVPSRAAALPSGMLENVVLLGKSSLCLTVTLVAAVVLVMLGVKPHDMSFLLNTLSLSGGLFFIAFAIVLGKILPYVLDLFISDYVKDFIKSLFGFS